MANSNPIQAQSVSASCTQYTTVRVKGVPSVSCNPGAIQSSQLFGQFGEIQHVCISRTHANQTMVVVEYRNATSAQLAVNTYSEHPVVHVSYADPIQQIQAPSVREKRLTSPRATTETTASTPRSRADYEREIAMLRQYKATQQRYTDKENECVDLRAQLEDMKGKYVWLQQQLQVMMQQSQELQSLVFCNPSPNYNSSSSASAQPQEDEEEDMSFAEGLEGDAGSSMHDTHF